MKDFIAAGIEAIFADSYVLNQTVLQFFPAFLAVSSVLLEDLQL